MIAACRALTLGNVCFEVSIQQGAFASLNQLEDLELYRWQPWQDGSDLMREISSLTGRLVCLCPGMNVNKILLFALS